MTLNKPRRWSEGDTVLAVWLLMLVGCIATWAVTLWAVVKIVLWLVGK